MRSLLVAQVIVGFLIIVALPLLDTLHLSALADASLRGVAGILAAAIVGVVGRCLMNDNGSVPESYDQTFRVERLARMAEKAHDVELAKELRQYAASHPKARLTVSMTEGEIKQARRSPEIVTGAIRTALSTAMH